MIQSFKIRPKGTNPGDHHWSWHVLVLLLLSAVYWFVRLPTAGLSLAFYDDGETLYHTLSFLSGRIPHLQDFNHHFYAYILQFALFSKLFGFSAELMREVAFINQVLTAYGVFLVARFVASPRRALLASLLVLLAREPWVLGFFQQYQINLFVVFILYTALLWLRNGADGWLGLAGLLSGILLTFDQRTLFIATIPLIAIWFRQRSVSAALQPLALLVIGFLIGPLSWLYYLYSHGALQAFIEQTFLFPKNYRVGSQSLLEGITQALTLHKFLLSETPLLLGAGLLGAIALFRTWRREGGAERALLLIGFVPVAIIPLFGGRSFDYYTIPWLPWLSIWAVFFTDFFQHLTPGFKKVATLVPTFPIVLSLFASTQALLTNDLPHVDDGRAEVIRYLNDHMAAEDTLYVWGYRLDLYVYLHRLSSFTMANTIAAFPDAQVRNPEKRLLHIYPKYEKLFISELAAHPPTWVVTFERRDRELNAPIKKIFFATLAQKYQREKQIEKRDFLGERCTFTIYRRRD